MSLTERAQKVTKHADAARLYEEALLASTRPTTSVDASDALDILESRFNGIEAVEEMGGADNYLASRVPKHLQPSHRPARRTGPKPFTPKPRKPKPSRRGQLGAAGLGYAVGRRSGARSVTRALGYDKAGRSVTSSVLFVLGSVIFLAVLYDVLTAPVAPMRIFQVFATIVNRIIAPIDPIGSKPSSSQSSAPAHQGQTMFDSIAASAASSLKGPTMFGTIGAAVSPLGPAVGSGLGALGHNTPVRKAPPFSGHPALGIPNSPVLIQ